MGLPTPGLPIFPAGILVAGGGGRGENGYVTGATEVPGGCFNGLRFCHMWLLLNLIKTISLS